MFSHVQLFATPWTIACQAPLSMGFSRQESWSGLLFSAAGDLPNPEIEPMSPADVPLSWWCLLRMCDVANRSPSASRASDSSRACCELGPVRQLRATAGAAGVLGNCAHVAWPFFGESITFVTFDLFKGWHLKTLCTDVFYFLYYFSC